MIGGRHSNGQLTAGREFLESPGNSLVDSQLAVELHLADHCPRKVNVSLGLYRDRSEITDGSSERGIKRYIFFIQHFSLFWREKNCNAK